MPPRKKKEAPVVDPAQTDIEQAIAAAPPPVDLSKVKPADLIAEFHTLKGHAETQGKAFTAYMKPTVTRMEEIRQVLHAKALADGVNGFPTDAGTAYLSHIQQHAIDPDATYTNAEGRVSTGRDALLDWMLDNWDDYGSEGLQLSISKAVVDKYLQDHANDENYKGKPPPGLKLSELIRLNIKAS